MRFVFFTLLLALAACDKTPGARTDGRVNVVATTGMVADLARRVGGPHVAVTALMGPGVDPHLFKAVRGDLKRLRGADLVLYNGKMLEGKLSDVLVKLASKKPVVAVTESIPDSKLLEGDAGHYDPHVWFDVALWANGCAIVADALADVDPSHADEYRAAAKEYEKELLALHDEVARGLAAIPKQRRVLITSHDAFRYFGRAYDLEVIGLQGISTVAEAGVKDISMMADLIVTRGIKAVFVESSVNPKAIEKVKFAVEAKGGTVTIGGELYSDAMGDEPPDDTYVGMVRTNVRKITKALK
ncbi:MAG: metal ABC transporter solute-binding protein, Zn/Mn family [Planctomycetota bacterium]|jgi:manganese/zinc/iron transport system substrate-binding protein